MEYKHKTNRKKMSIRNILFNRITANILAGIALVAVLILGVRIMLDKITRHNLELTVPDLSGMSVEEAGKVAETAGMRLEVIDSVYVRRMGKGLIYRQNPSAGSRVKEGRRILLTINAVNPKKVMMPNLVGYSLRQAKAEIMSKGLLIGRLTYVTDIATNNVLRQLHDGTDIAPGTMIESEAPIDLVLGLNNDDCVTYAPAVTGLRYMNAIEAVHDNSLNIKDIVFDETVRNYTDSLEAVVFRMEPDYGAEPLLMGTDISLFLTTDMSKVPVPEDLEDEENAGTR